ncbi:helix-turn-helix domain-containing protein [Glaciihabitans sp. dw_435]|uniref:helix-turn-helix transcriptional regulator n=1 Tax=Glaciihabitans sp. dw_435 TaxID=2720081 RepID=UPI001BD2CB4B
MRMVDVMSSSNGPQIPSNQKNQSIYLNIEDLAAQLGLSVQTLYRWRSTGADMPQGFLIGSRVRWRQETVDAWLSTQEAKARS